MDIKKNLREISLYSAYTFTLTWSIWLLTLSELNLRISNETLIVVGTFVPSFVGLLMEYKINGIKEFTKSLKRLVAWKIGFKWYAYIFGLMPTIMLLSYLVLRLSGRNVPNLEFPVYAVPLVFLYIMLFMGPLGEEAGWRGFLFPRMINGCRPFFASILIGLIWSLWHLPLFFIDTTIQSELAKNYSFALAFGGYILYTLMISIQISILYINTKGNNFGVVLLHTMANTSLGMMPLILSKTGAIVLLEIMILVTLILIIFNRKKLFKNNIRVEKLFYH